MSNETRIAAIMRGLEKAHAIRNKKTKDRHERQRVQLAKFAIGQDVKVIVDHDGPEGRWVGVLAQTIGFDYHAKFPWIIQAPGGSKMYASAEMLDAAYG